MALNRPVQGSVRGPQQEWHAENGRYYNSQNRGGMFPIDEQEQDRLDIFHKFFTLARGGRLFSVPIHINDGTRILDLGTGTGIWAIAMAEAFYYHPNRAFVHGVDVAMIQPEHIFENSSFHLMDIETPWRNMPYGEDSWDLIHIRAMYGSVRSWPTLYRKVLSHLRPGCGWVEHVEIDWTPQCKGGSWPPDFQTLHLFEELFSAMDEVNMPMRVDPGATRERLLAAGFVDISEERIQVPWNPWPPNLVEKEVGRWFNLGLTQGLEATSMAPLTRVKGWTDEEVRNFVKHCQLEIARQQVHGHFWLTGTSGRQGGHKIIAAAGQATKGSLESHSVQVSWKDQVTDINARAYVKPRTSYRWPTCSLATHYGATPAVLDTPSLSFGSSTALATSKVDDTGIVLSGHAEGSTIISPSFLDRTHC